MSQNREFWCKKNIYKWKVLIKVRIKEKRKKKEYDEDERMWYKNKKEY